MASSERKNLRYVKHGNVKEESDTAERRNSDNGKWENQDGETRTTLHSSARAKRRLRRNYSEPTSETRDAGCHDTKQGGEGLLAQTCPVLYQNNYHEKEISLRLKSSGIKRSPKEHLQRRRSEPSMSFLHSSDSVCSVSQDNVEFGSDSVLNKCDICAVQDVECGYCKNCKQYLCRQCCEGHRKITATKMHVILSTDKILPENILTESEQDLAHETMFRQKSHFKESEESDRYSTGQNLRKLLKKLTGMRIKRLEQIKSLKYESKTKLSQVYQLRNDLVEHINMMVENASEDIRHKQEATRSEINGQKKTVDSYIEEVTKLCQSIDISSLQRCSQKNASNTLKEIEERYQEIIVDAKNLEQEFGEFSLNFVPDSKLLNLKDSKPFLGDIKLVKENVHDTTITKFADSEFSSWCPGDVNETTCITGIACLHDGRLILADQDNKAVKLFDSELKHQSRVELTVPPWSLTVTDDNKILVTLPELTQVWQFSADSGTLKKELTLETEYECLGIIEIKDEIIISTDSGELAGLIAFSRTGGVNRKKSYDTTDKYCLLKRPNYLQKSKDSKVLYVSDVDMGLYGISSCDFQTVLFCYNAADLLGPLGIAVDDSGNIFVCGFYSHNIHQLKNSGKRCGIITTKDLTPAPQCLCFHEHKNAIVVSLDKKYDLKVLKLC